MLAFGRVGPRTGLDFAHEAQRHLPKGCRSVGRRARGMRSPVLSTRQRLLRRVDSFYEALHSGGEALPQVLCLVTELLVAVARVAKV